MIDPHATIINAQKYGPDVMRPYFHKGTIHYNMIVWLMVWMSTDSMKQVLEQAVSELYAKERTAQTVKNKTKC